MFLNLTHSAQGTLIGIAHYSYEWRALGWLLFNWEGRHSVALIFFFFFEWSLLQGRVYFIVTWDFSDSRHHGIFHGVFHHNGIVIHLLPAFGLLTGGYVIPPKVLQKSFFFISLGESPRANSPSLNLHRKRMWGFLLIAHDPFLMGGKDLPINHGLFKDRSCRFS